MNTHFKGEAWRVVNTKTPTGPENRLEVSNYGRVRTFNKSSNGKILKGSLINGYPIIKLKLFLPRTAAVELELSLLREKIRMQQDFIGLASENVAEAETLLTSLKKELDKKNKADIKSRTVNFQSLVHRLVAEYFLRPPAKDETVVAHIDYDKKNNYHRNLKWMTVTENMAHQQNSPHVISKQNSLNNSKANKLTITRVMLLKKLLGEDKPIKNLAKQFKVTETQILRIKRGENWGTIKAG
jgi:hypothetical protein